MNFVVGRRYILKIDNIETSLEIEPKSSVPQGSHFGPVLYILFTNGLGLGELSYADDTKLYQIIRNMDDRNQLQDRIDKLEAWSDLNGLTLNPSKTFHVSYGKRMIHTIYFLKNMIIAEKDVVRDLGVLFDSGLTFKKHIEYVSKKINQMIGAARRMVTELKQPMLIRRIYSVYIQPLADYCSVVWNQNRITYNNPITLAHKKITRIALNVFHGMDPRRHIAYEKRCEILNQDGPAIRRSTQAAVLCIKILKREVELSCSEIIIGHLNMNTDARIRHLLIRTDKRIPPKSPVAMLLAAAGAYESVINLKLTTNTISTKIKELNTTRRSRIADSRTHIRRT